MLTSASPTSTLAPYQIEVGQLIGRNQDEQSLSEEFSKRLAEQKSPSEHLLFIAEIIQQFFFHKKKLPLKIAEEINAFLAKLSYEALIEQLPGAHAGKSGLWLLADAASLGKPEAFLAVWEKLGGNIPVEALLKEAQEGPYKGITTLWWLAYAAVSGRPEAFLAVWEKLGGNIPVDALSKEAQEGPNKGITVLWLLADAASLGKPEAFLAVWEKLGRNILVEALLKEIQEGPNKGITALWLLACATAKGKPEAFLAVWEKFAGIISAEALLKEAQEGPNKGMAILWLLACATAKGKPEAFLAVWEKLGRDIPVKALLREAQQVPSKGKNTLWWLAYPAGIGQPAPFLAVWERVKKAINLTALLCTAQHGPDAGKDTLGRLVQGALRVYPLNAPIDQQRIIKENALKSLQVVKDALMQLPGSLPAATLQHDSPLDKLLQRESLPRLGEARNHFFLALEAYKQTDTKENEESVWKKAEKALKAGYLNAFYDLGNHYFAIDEIERGIAAYEKVPADSWQYSRVVEQLCAHHFGKITASSSTDEKRQHLKVTLGYALKTTGELREWHIQLLAAQYLLDFNVPMPVPQDLVPSDWLALMDSDMSVEMGLKVLEELKTRRTLEKEKQALQEQLAQEKQAKAQLLLENAVLVKENTGLKQAQTQTQPAGCMLNGAVPTASELPFLPQFSAVDVTGGKRLREVAASQAIMPEKLPVDSTLADEDEQISAVKKIRVGNATH